MRQTLDKRLQISPSDVLKQYFIVSPPMKLINSNGGIDEIKIPTRFKIIGKGKNFIRIKNIGFGHFPYEEKSPYAGRIYTVVGDNIDLFLKPPPGTGESMPTPGGSPFG